jgi:hypothetical protein
MLQWKSFSLPKKNRVPGVVEEKNRRERDSRGEHNTRAVFYDRI